MKKLKIDYITLAYLQINNPIIACDFTDFHQAVEKVLGRPVWSHEFANTDDIKKEINQKFELWCKEKHV
jgi:hypothetical protein